MTTDEVTPEDQRILDRLAEIHHRQDQISLAVARGVITTDADDPLWDENDQLTKEYWKLQEQLSNEYWELQQRLYGPSNDMEPKEHP